MKACSVRLKPLALGLMLGLASASSTAEELRTDIDDQTAVAVTIYNENLALIKDQRSITLPTGIQNLAFRGVSGRMRPETAMLRSQTSPGSLSVLEQNFDFDLLTPQKLLEKYTGQQVKIATMNPATGIEITEEATILSTQQGVVVRIGDRIETNPHGRFIFDQVPDNLRDMPTLVTQLNNRTRGEQSVEMSYLTSGLAWKADYVAELNADDNQLDLLGWVTLTNNSGASYNNARLQLVAGDVNQVRQEMRKSRNMVMAMAEAAPAADQMSEESLFEYHLYTLNRPTDVLDKQTKQVSLLTASSVPVNKQFLLQGNNYYYRSSYGDIGQKMKIGVFVEFANREESGLGMPIPKGVVRVYKKDSQGNAQFIGEDSIDHTPKNEDIRLKLGDAFDVTADKKQTDFSKRPHRGHYSYAAASSYRILLKNAKKEPVTVTVREPVPGDWVMEEESHPHRKVASGTAEWQIEVPAEGESELSYRVLVQY